MLQTEKETYNAIPFCLTGLIITMYEIIITDDWNLCPHFFNLWSFYEYSTIRLILQSDWRSFFVLLYIKFFRKPFFPLQFCFKPRTDSNQIIAWIPFFILIDKCKHFLFKTICKMYIGTTWFFVKNLMFILYFSLVWCVFLISAMQSE